MDCERMPLSPPQVVDGITLKFPAKLWRIVNSCRSGSIAWEDGGETIRIHRRHFEAEYLSSSKYFKTTNFPSFIRQLNIYGFRKVPTTTRWQDCGTIFEYRHECFIKGHPELLPEVKRNTAVRRTLREQSFKNMVPHVISAQVDCREIARAKETHLRHPKIKLKTVDDCHPLLKTSSSMVKYGSVSQPCVQTKPPGMSVHVKPRVGVSDITQMSPGRLQDQVAGLLAAINTGHSDDEMITAAHREQLISAHGLDQRLCEETSATCVPCRQKEKPGQSQILFLPNTLCDKSPFELRATEDQLSQESVDFNKQLMFSCPPVDKDEDELGQSLEHSFNLSCDDIDPDLLISNSNMKGLQVSESVLPKEELDNFPPNINMSDTLTEFGEEHGFLTPAYYDPVTGTVTLLIPSLNPES